MIQLTSDEETSSGEYGLWLRRWSKTILQSEMRQGAKLLLGLLSGPSPNDFWFDLPQIGHNETSLFMFICLSKKLSKCANGCLCQETILPRVSFPRGSTWTKMVMTRKNRCQPICIGQNRLLGCARRRLALSLLLLSCWLALAEVWLRVSAEVTFMKSVAYDGPIMSILRWAWSIVARYVSFVSDVILKTPFAYAW